MKWKGLAPRLPATVGVTIIVVVCGAISPPSLIAVGPAAVAALGKIWASFTHHD